MAVPMTNRPKLMNLLLCCLSLPLVISNADLADAAQAAADAESVITWDRVKPVFQKHCFACHRGEQARGGLDLSTIEGIKSGSTSGAAVVAGKPDQSMIYTLAAHLENPTMPPNRPKVPQRELDLLYGWIEGGLSEKSDPAVDESEKKSRKSFVRPRPTIASPQFSLLPLPSAAVPDVASGSAAAVPAKRVARREHSVAAAAARTRTHASAITALAVSPTASIAAVSGNREVLVYQWSDQQLQGRFPFSEGDIFTLRFSGDGSLLLAGGGQGAASGTVVAFDVTTGDRVFQLGDERDIVLTADISPDGRRVAIGGPSRVVKLFDSTTGEQTAIIRRHTDWITSLRFSHDGLLLASGDRFGGLYVWEAETGSEFYNLRGHNGAVSSVLWSADTDQLISSGHDGTIRFWDMHRGIQTSRLDSGGERILAADNEAFGGLVYGGRDHRIGIRQQEALTAINMADEVVQLAITHDRSHVIAADASGNITLFRFDDGTPAGNFELPATITPKE